MFVTVAIFLKIFINWKNHTMNQLFNKGVPFYDNGASTCRGGSSFSSLDFRMGRAVKKTSPGSFLLDI